MLVYAKCHIDFKKNRVMSDLCCGELTDWVSSNKDNSYNIPVQSMSEASD